MFDDEKWSVFFHLTPLEIRRYVTAKPLWDEVGN
jgi:hypothetical protein